ncbi:uncharacterized protein N7482_003965 [Penicillium canariense]|uniref:Zn(2)-C6 fungal-type domain-containing protein n=1 Tax=Penicillium canariense TaxID=189055 RepID=A0A9W9LPN4_9EURO|nr:uncharacterized protein N7482_003965 [Penicillium canariense]KAJ5168371.1 hypothetical protein N7482_003965 [Penicillium canariense]
MYPRPGAVFSDDYFVMYDGPQPQPQGPNNSLSSTQNPGFASFTRWAPPTIIPCSQGSSASISHSFAWHATSQHSWSGPSAATGYASSAGDRILNGYPALLDRSAPEQRSSSPDAQFPFIIEDPTNPQKHREKRVRTKEELESQKEGIRILKESGGACIRCYRSKKKCAPGTPCPPCASKRRKCIRRISEPLSAPAQPISSPAQLASLSDNPTLTDSLTVETVSNQDLPSVDPELEDYFDPFSFDTWRNGMDSIDGAYNNPSYPFVGTDTGARLTS